MKPMAAAIVNMVMIIFYLDFNLHRIIMYIFPEGTTVENNIFIVVLKLVYYQVLC
jgi:hypothetical protein